MTDGVDKGPTAAVFGLKSNYQYLEEVQELTPIK